MKAEVQTERERWAEVRDILEQGMQEYKEKLRRAEMESEAIDTPESGIVLNKESNTV